MIPKAFQTRSWSACPDCGEVLQESADTVGCMRCQQRWPVVDGVPYFIGDFPYWGGPLGTDAGSQSRGSGHKLEVSASGLSGAFRPARFLDEPKSRPGKLVSAVGLAPGEPGPGYRCRYGDQLSRSRTAISRGDRDGTGPLAHCVHAGTVRSGAAVRHQNHPKFALVSAFSGSGYRSGRDEWRPGMGC